MDILENVKTIQNLLSLILACEIIQIFNPLFAYMRNSVKKGVEL